MCCQEPLDELYWLKMDNLKVYAAKWTNQIDWYRHQYKPEIDNYEYDLD